MFSGLPHEKRFSPGGGKQEGGAGIYRGFKGSSKICLKKGISFLTFYVI